MSHKTLVSGTAYNVTGGKSMVSGTSYNVSGGRTLVGGTGYNISFVPPEPTAMLYSDGNMVFQLGSSVESGKTLTASYTGFEDVSYSVQMNITFDLPNMKMINTYTVDTPWNVYKNNIQCVHFSNNIEFRSLSCWFAAFLNLTQVNFGNFIWNNVVNMCNTFRACKNLTGSPVCGNNVTNMSFAYCSCNNLTGSPVCGNNVTDMSYAYSECCNLTGSPVCGANVMNMSHAYNNCQQLAGNPVCGNNVTNMSFAYCSCHNLTGSPVCGNNVTDMYRAYGWCEKITGSPVCGSNVSNMALAYYGCYNLTGAPVCGDKVTYMSNTYSECTNMTGIAICGNNVTHADGLYYNCANIGANAYFYSNNLVRVMGCFYVKNRPRRLNLYVPANSTTNTTVHYINTFSLVGKNITWTNAGSYQYNTAYNIYIYPVENVAAAAIANGDEEANEKAGIVVDNGASTGSGASND